MLKKSNYVVYQASLCGDILYIGSGVSGRENHCNSGTSHVYKLNEMHFSGSLMEVKVIKSLMSKSDSLDLEKELILKHKPSLNVVHLLKSKMAKLNLLSNLSFNIIKDLKGSMKEHMGIDFYRRYVNQIEVIIKFFGVSNLVDGFTLPSVPTARHLLDDPSTRTLFEKFSHRDSMSDMKKWMKTVFEYKKEGARVTLKVKSSFIERLGEDAVRNSGLLHQEFS